MSSSGTDTTATASDLGARLDLPADRFERLAVRVLLVLGWLRFVVPQALTVLRFKREYFTSAATPPEYPLSEAVGVALTAAIVVVSGILILRRVPSAPRALVVPLGVWLAPLIALSFSDLLADDLTVFGSLPYLMFGAAVWLVRPPLQVFSTIGWVTLTLLLVCLLLPLVDFTHAVIEDTTEQPTDGINPFQGDLLAGVFVQPNVLGIAAALGLPFVLLLPRVVRWGGVIATLAVLLWSASQTGQIAAVAVLAGYALRRRPAALAALASLGVVLTLATPLIVSDPRSFTERGQVWQAALEGWAASPIAGQGSGWFTEQAASIGPLTRLGFHGHNLFVHTLAVGGVLGALAVFVLLLVCARRAFRFTRVPAGYVAPALFIVGLAFVGWLEGSLRLPRADQALLWMPLGMILFSSSTSAEVDVVEGPEDAHRAPTVTSPTSAQQLRVGGRAQAQPRHERVVDQRR